MKEENVVLKVCVLATQLVKLLLVGIGAIVSASELLSPDLLLALVGAKLSRFTVGCGVIWIRVLS